MLHTKPNKIRLSLCVCVISVLFTPTITQADTAMVLAEAETGSVAARQAADQKAALAKKAAEREARKAAEAQKSVEAAVPPVENTTPAEVKTEK